MDILKIIFTFGTELYVLWRQNLKNRGARARCAGDGSAFDIDLSFIDIHVTYQYMYNYEIKYMYTRYC